MRNYPPALYFDSTGLVSIRNVTIERAWNAVVITMGTANLAASNRSAGGSIENLWFSAFNRGLAVDYCANNLDIDGLKVWVFGGTDFQNGAIAYNPTFDAVVIGQADGLSISNSLIYNGRFVRNKGGANAAQGTVFVANTVFDQTRGVSINTGKTFFDNCWFVPFDDAGDGSLSGVIIDQTGGQIFIANSLLVASPSSYPAVNLAFDSAGEFGRSPLLSIQGSSIEGGNTTHDTPMFRMTGSNGSVNNLILQGNSIHRFDKSGGGNYGTPLIYVENGTGGAVSTIHFTGNRIDPMNASESPLLQLVNDAAHNISYGILPAGWSVSYPAAPVQMTVNGIMPAWIAPTLSNSWVNYGSPSQVAGYRKDAAGRVWLRGVIKNGTIADGTVLFTLPAGFRPTATENLLCHFYSASATKYIAAVLNIYTTGEVQIFYCTDSTAVSLGDLSFST